MAAKAKTKAAQNGASAPTDELTGPEFDFGRVDRKWRQKLRRLGALEARSQARLEALYQSGDFADDELDALMVEADELEAEQDRLIASVLVAVPDGWLIYDAPDVIDWHDAESINYIRQDRRTALYTGMLIAAGNPVGN